MNTARPALATFRLVRDHDVSGISGEGVVAEGVQFSDGWVVTHWLDQPPMNEPKTDVWHHKGTHPITKIHGHAGATRIVWADDATKGRTILASAVGRAYALADRWQAAHGSSMFLVRAAGAELRDALDESGDAPGEVVRSRADAQVSSPPWANDTAAAECSAQHHGFPGDHRQCIRAAQHRGDHIDEHGFHWSDTVAVYPVDDSQAPSVESEAAALTPRQRAYKAVNEYTATLGYTSLTTRTHIWRAVNRALKAAGHPADPSTQCRLPHEMEA